MIGVLRPQRSTILSRRGSGRPSVNGSIGTMNPSGGTGRSGSTSNVLIRTSISLGREPLAVARPPDRLLAPWNRGIAPSVRDVLLSSCSTSAESGGASRIAGSSLSSSSLGVEAYCFTCASDVGRVRRTQLKEGEPPNQATCWEHVQSAKAPDSHEVVEEATSSTRLVSRVRRLTAWPLASAERSSNVVRPVFHDEPGAHPTSNQTPIATTRPVYCPLGHLGRIVLRSDLLAPERLAR
jgi:hypothetical protein